jgi:hypothetical protein
MCVLVPSYSSCFSDYVLGGSTVQMHFAENAKCLLLCYEDGGYCTQLNRPTLLSA